MEMCDRSLPDRGLRKYFEKEFAEFDEVRSLSSKTEYEWAILADWHSCCGFETEEELEFLKELGYKLSDFEDDEDDILNGDLEDQFERLMGI